MKMRTLFGIRKNGENMKYRILLLFVAFVAMSVNGIVAANFLPLAMPFSEA